MSPEGTRVEISFVADEGGFQPQGEGVPEAPPHVAEQLKIAAEQKAQGIEFDERGFRI